MFYIIKIEKLVWKMRPELKDLFHTVKSMKNYPPQKWGYEKIY